MATLLFLEDDPVQRLLLEMELARLTTQATFAWHVAKTPEEAQAHVAALADATGPVVLCFDQGIPGSDGLDLLRSARRALPGSHAVLFTAASGTASADDVEVVLKPSGLEAYRETLRSLVAMVADGTRAK